MRDQGEMAAEVAFVADIPSTLEIDCHRKAHQLLHQWRIGGDGRKPVGESSGLVRLQHARLVAGW